MEINHVIDKILHDRQYKNGYQPPATQRMFVIGDRTVGTMNNIIVFSGLPKTGKSSFLSAAIASAFLPYSVYTISTHLPDKRKGVLLIDTESSEDDFYKQVGRIKTSIGKDKMPNNFHAFMLRDCNASEIKEYTEYYLQLHPEISIVYIDGFLDLLMNYNDERESKQIIDWLKRITKQYNILCVGVVHTGKKDNHTLGHFGSMIDRYCQSVLLVEKDDKKQLPLHELKAKLMRSDCNFDPVVLENNKGVFTQIF
jgi:hypothetical protein